VKNAIRAADAFARHGVPQKIRDKALEFAPEPFRR